jgi:hypothetical protein
MPERAFIIHGYLGYPQEAWLPWLKLELEKRGYEVSLPAMPNAERPTVPEWVAFIKKLVGEPDGKTVMIGHSLGGHAVLHYLEEVGGAGGSVRRTVLVASSFPVAMSPEEFAEKTDGDEALRPWFSVGVEPNKVRKAAGKCTVILSDDDPYISALEAKAAFQHFLGATIIMEHGRGHFNEDSGMGELPSALDAALS